MLNYRYVTLNNKTQLGSLWSIIDDVLGTEISTITRDARIAAENRAKILVAQVEQQKLIAQQEAERLKQEQQRALQETQQTTFQSQEAVGSNLKTYAIIGGGVVALGLGAYLVFKN